MDESLRSAVGGITAKEKLFSNVFSDRVTRFLPPSSIGTPRTGYVQTLRLLAPAGRFAVRATAHRADAASLRLPLRGAPARQRHKGTLLHKACQFIAHAVGFGFRLESSLNETGGGRGQRPPLRLNLRSFCLQASRKDLTVACNRALPAVPALHLSRSVV